ncbi:MAG: tryptophan synthase subunit beta [Nanoarchaeota archaeon]|nr:tryptophan synthase subunit beta [Nanoarchaeota archaeon]
MKGTFGQYGGQYVPPQLQGYLDELESSYEGIKKDRKFQAEMKHLLSDYVGRPSPLYLSAKLSKRLGFKVYLKREDLNHTGAHKINNTLGQALIAKHMSRKEVIAETGAGQHGVATATAAALLGLRCRIFMGEVDAEKQRLNVYRMQMLGAQVHIVKSGLRTLKEAVDEAIGYLIEHPEVYYLLGSVVGPHPYPTMVRDFQAVIGKEARKQILEKEGKLPDALVACVGGGSNAMGLFYEFLNDDVELHAVEPAGKGLETGKHAATLTLGTPGVIHGFRCLLLQDKEGNPMEVYSIASGLDYPGVGPEPSMLKDIKRLRYGTVTDKEAVDAFHMLSREEGLIPALESAHAVAYLDKERAAFKGKIVILNLSGRGDKDVETVSKLG